LRAHGRCVRNYSPWDPDDSFRWRSVLCPHGFGVRNSQSRPGGERGACCFAVPPASWTETLHPSATRPSTDSLVAEDHVVISLTTPWLFAVFGRRASDSVCQAPRPIRTQTARSAKTPKPWRTPKTTEKTA